MSATEIYDRLGIKREKSIHRIDQEKKGTHGWNVVVIWKKVLYSKFFSDSHYRDEPELSHIAAVKYRDKLEKEVGKPHTRRKITGTAYGIRRRIKNNSPVFEISWSPREREVARTSVSIKKYGVREARALAEKIRQERWLETLEPPPTPRKAKPSRRTRTRKTGGRK